METSPSASTAELALWRRLMTRALRRGVPRPEAEDLASQAFLKALEAYVPERGDFAPFCGTVHANLLRNWWRDRKPIEPWDEQTHDLPGPDDPHSALADQEERAMYQQIADCILAVLEPEEAALFLALGEQAREAEQAAVSAAARRLGLEPQKAWDVFRRIQRKSRPFLGVFSDAVFCRPLILVEDCVPLRRLVGRVEEPEPALPKASQADHVSRAPLWPPFPPLFQIAACADAGFSAFAARLPPDQRAQLADLLPDSVTPG